MKVRVNATISDLMAYGIDQDIAERIAGKEWDVIPWDSHTISSEWKSANWQLTGSNGYAVKKEWCTVLDGEASPTPAPVEESAPAPPPEPQFEEIIRGPSGSILLRSDFVQALKRFAGI